MSRRLALLAAAFLTLAGLPAARSAPVTPGFASPNVEWLANVPLHADSAGARIVGDFLYASDSRAFTIYDISNRELPVPVSVTPLPQLPYYAQEDLATNGKILVLGQGSDTGNVTDLLWVYDVADKKLPKLLTTFRGASSHTVSCVLDCTYLYNSNGQIIDLRKPAHPKVVGDWNKAAKITQGGHDVTEVAPGLVVTSSNPILYLDARKTPAKPKLLASARAKEFVHGNLWPNAARDKFLLVGGESGGGGCQDASAGSFSTWDTTNWAKTKTFKQVDQYRPPDSLPTEGGYPVSTYCTHWFTTRPGYRNGGTVAMGWYEHGTRFLQVSPKGKIKEVGWFIPAGTSVSAAYWVSKDLLYLFDYNRGLDIVRFHDKPRPFPARSGSPGRGLPPTKAPLFKATLRPSFGTFCPVPVSR